MKTESAKKALYVFILCIFFPCTGIFGVHAEQMYSPTWGYSLDIPEGFNLAYKQADTSYQFEHDFFPVTLIVRSWPESVPTGEKMRETLEKLNAAGETEDFIWFSRTCTIALFDMRAHTGINKGWAVCAPLDKEKGVALVLCYAPETQFRQSEPLIVSTLNSFSPHIGNPNLSGIMSDFAYPKKGALHTSINIGDTEIPVEFDMSDSEAHNALIEREYAILTIFAETPLWEKAWQRYYRMIYRDAYKRLGKAAFAIHNALEGQTHMRPDTGKTADKNKPAAQNGTADTDKTFAQRLLSWTQTLPYERRRTASDFTGLIDTIRGVGSDCDSRALLLAVLMSHMNYNTMLFISPQYSHALFGIDIKGSGARLEQNGTQYLLGETTAPVNLGLVPQDMSDSTKWFGIAGLGL